MSSIPLVSCLVATYNYGRFLTPLVDSILSQQLPRGVTMELILVDDGSDDDTQSVLEKFACYSNFRIVRQPNGGHAAALNRAASLARGKYYFFSDADDEWLAGKVAGILEAYESYRPAAVFHESTSLPLRSPQLPPLRPDLRRSTDALSETHRITRAEDSRYRAPFLAILSCQTMTSELAQEIFPIPEACVRHVDLYLNYLALVKADIVFDRRIWTYYRDHSESHTTQLRRNEPSMVALENRVQQLVLDSIRAYSSPRASNVERSLREDLFYISVQRKLEVGVLAALRYVFARQPERIGLRRRAIELIRLLSRWSRSKARINLPQYFRFR